MTNPMPAFLLVALLMLPVPSRAQDAASQWWADISGLADDGMEGRLTGSRL